MNYIKLNRRPLKVYDTATGRYFFNFEGRRHSLENFYRTCTGWTGCNYPDYIHGVEAGYYDPLFIEIIEGYEPTVNVYRTTVEQK